MDSNKGILHAEAGRKKFRLTRFEPSSDLAPFVERYWLVQWDLRGQAPYRQVILSYPNVNLAFENEGGTCYSGVYGVPSVTYARLLRGEGIVFGVKFKPGGFYPFWKQPISILTDRSVCCSEIFGSDMRPPETRLFAQERIETMLMVVEEFLRQRQPERDENVEFVSRITEMADRDKSIYKVEDLAARFDLSVRKLQRLFDRYVGVSPKWVIRRYRLQEAAELIESGKVTDWAQLSAELGYYDQAHFIKDFKSLIGKTPGDYTLDLPLRNTEKFGSLSARQ